jgi:hypothetical protein
MRFPLAAAEVGGVTLGYPGNARNRELSMRMYGGVAAGASQNGAAAFMKTVSFANSRSAVTNVSSFELGISR